MNDFYLGGAGTGKSFLIKITAKWAEKILRQAGDDPSKPKVLLLGPTGMAAMLIGKFKRFNSLPELQTASFQMDRPFTQDLASSLE